MNEISAGHHVALAAVAAALSMSAALAGCAAHPAAAASRNATEPLAVTIARAAMADVPTAIDSGGVVRAHTTATISARILAPIREVRVSPGDRVRAGQTLVVLAGDDLAAGARAARAAALAAEQGAKAAAAERLGADAALALARASHQRIAGLQAKRSATAQELDEATAALRSAEARAAGAAARAVQAASALDSARAAGEQASTIDAFRTVAAPFDGLVTEKLVEPGNMASPGMPLLRLEDTRGFRLEVRVDESRIGHVRHGQRVPVFLGTGATAIEGTVVEISRAIDADARAVLLKIALPDRPELRSGEFGKARLGGTPRRVLTVPPSAVVHHGQLTAVFVVEGGQARLRLVRLSESEVVAGLEDGERVILSPPPALTDGRPVVVGGR